MNQSMEGEVGGARSTSQHAFPRCNPHSLARPRAFLRPDLMEIPLVASTSPMAALCTGEMDRSAALISHTVFGSNQTSGSSVSPQLRVDEGGACGQASYAIQRQALGTLDGGVGAMPHAPLDRRSHPKSSLVILSRTRDDQLLLRLGQLLQQLLAERWRKMFLQQW